MEVFEGFDPAKIPAIGQISQATKIPASPLLMIVLGALCVLCSYDDFIGETITDILGVVIPLFASCVAIGKQ
jgi:hypothetical protein